MKVKYSSKKAFSSTGHKCSIAITTITIVGKCYILNNCIIRVEKMASEKYR